MKKKFVWSEMTWPEIREAIGEERVVLLPVGAIEQHGHHLPVDSDSLIAEEICRRAAAEMPDRAIVAPTIAYGFNPNHMDFPGTITIGIQTLVNYGIDVCKSIAYHGFSRILIVNGHGGNISALDVVAKVVTLETGAFVAMVSHFTIEPVKRAVLETKESPSGGGMVHADEYETSVYLAIRPEAVQMDKAVRELGLPPSRYFWIDQFSGGENITSASFMEPWSTFSESGVLGDPTVASKEKGERYVAEAVNGLVALVDEMRARPSRPGVDHHGWDRSDVIRNDPRVLPW